MTEPTPDRLAGAVWGHLVGDAFGVPYEFGPPRSPSELRWGASGSHGQPAGTWSDDGALMLALLDSLLPDGARVPHDVRFDLADQGRRALDWADRGAYTPDGDGRFDIGRATAAALMALRAGAAPADAGRTDERAQGNGSLMRILPIALTGTDPLPFPELVERAHQASRVTHGHPACQVACALYVFICRELLRGQRDRPAVLAQTRQKLRLLYEGRGRDPRRPEHLAAIDSLEAHTERTGRTFVLDSFWSAWDAFAGAGSYAEAVDRAVAYGNDTDTTACIAGGMAGIYFGEEAIPPAWRAGLRGGDIVEPLVERLCAAHGWSTSAGNPIRVPLVDAAMIPASAAWTGRVGMTFLPGKRDPHGGRGRRHWRELTTDVAGLRDQGVGMLLLLVGDREIDELGVPAIADELATAGVDLLRHPITDLGVPADAEALARDLDRVMDALRSGRSVAVACRGGLGRTGTVVACLLVNAGLDAQAAINETRRARPGAIETSAQEAFVRHWAERQSRFAPPPAGGALPA